MDGGFPLFVMAFESPALSTPDRIRAAARRLAAAHDEPGAVVGVLSAMGGTTDDLLELAGMVSDTPDLRELDMLVSTGERISCALCAMALLDLGKRAVSLTGSQAGIVTDAVHGAATIVDVRPDRVRSELAAGVVVLVAGFQGVSVGSEVTTLGPGGTRVSAIALATALGALRCELVADDPDGAIETLQRAGDAAASGTTERMSHDIGPVSAR
jgi:aspartate kinase